MDCAQCPVLLDRTQSCPVAGQPVLVAVMVAFSLLPYLLTLYFLPQFCLRTSPAAKTYVLVGIVTYTLALLLKEVVQQGRPEGACSHSYGMPSNHVALITSFAIVSVSMRPQPLFVLSMLALVLCEACSRVYLNYHTPAQCLAGSLLGSISALCCLSHLRKDKASLAE